VSCTERHKADNRTKLSLSHALSQSVKISLFEELIGSTIEQTKDIPKSLSQTGKVGVSTLVLAYDCALTGSFPVRRS